ncbi:MAG TPA: hypothetical protein V6D12_06645 [Candidatus Obscuribacterales bacterium]
MGLPGKGGRAKRTPYQCKTKRIPVDLEPQIDELISRFVEGEGDSLYTPTYTADQDQILAEKIHELEQEREGLRTEIEKLKQQLEDESHQRLRGEIRELEQKLSAKHKQMIDQRDKLWKENRDLQEQRDKFERSYVHVARELRALRESLPDDDEVRSLRDDSRRSLPGAAELLQQLRVKSPKLKVGLRDLEVILEGLKGAVF